ncbi:biotin--[acetyl-CoA-carboxylase] ligase [Glaciihabitans sp. dw_435]|uniref:biotin--[acetyl-CoA-carboxylase] ligase n=1 Tax=Glaciihabitans sp. dw_435 TaxID=2720081 RepID=UPI001BD5D0C1|nr:biotin--[acetyl-CoA-carboxylase] ligase [Glaciihabitans sp. dw_435]
MFWQKSRSESAKFVALDEIGSTNDFLAGSAREADASGARDTDEPHFSVVVTTSQTAGRGRLGRVWVAPPGKTLAASVLLRPRLADGSPLPLEHFGWLPLIAGLAMTRAVRRVLAEASEIDVALPVDGEAIPDAPVVGLKWPNDVQIDGFKVSGLLAELLPSGDSVIIGSGLNLTMTADELPVPTATSLLLAGARGASSTMGDDALAYYLTELRTLTTRFVTFDGDADASGIRTAISDECTTLGQPVRVELPGGDFLVGTATGLDSTGRLEVRESQDGPVTSVAAGDVTHLRYE